MCHHLLNQWKWSSNTWTSPQVHPITMNMMFLNFTGALLLLVERTAPCFFSLGYFRYSSDCYVRLDYRRAGLVFKVSFTVHFRYMRRFAKSSGMACKPTKWKNIERECQMDQISGLESSSQGGITIAHSIIIVDHLGKGSSRPLNIYKHQKRKDIPVRKKRKEPTGLCKKSPCSEKRYKNARWIRFLAWILLRRGGITCAHSIIIADQLGKGSSLPSEFLKSFNHV